MANTETMTKREAKRLFWKGLWYVATGMSLMILALAFCGITFTLLDQPWGHPAAPYVVFSITLIMGTFWGGIFVWKGCGLVDLSTSKNSPNEYGTAYRLAKLIAVILSKTIFRRHKFRWQRIRPTA